MNSTLTHFPLDLPYKAYLLDAYGVFWGGNAVGPLPGAKELMERLVRQGRVVGILSNSSQPALKEIEKIHAYGLIKGVHFHFYITSGQIASDLIQNDQLPFATTRKKYCLSFPPHPKFSSPHLLFQKSHFSYTEKASEADFIYGSIPHIEGKDQLDPELFRAQVQELSKTGLPLFVANPDHFAHEGNPPQPVVRQGAIAALYEQLGGEVCSIGKPHPIAYNYAIEAFKKHGITSPQEIVMVGDTPETDIRGANQSKMASLLITKTGMAAHKNRALASTDIPTYFVERFCA